MHNFSPANMRESLGLDVFTGVCALYPHNLPSASTPLYLARLMR